MLGPFDIRLELLRDQLEADIGIGKLYREIAAGRYSAPLPRLEVDGKVWTRPPPDADLARLTSKSMVTLTLTDGFDAEIRGASVGRDHARMGWTLLKSSPAEAARMADENNRIRFVLNACYENLEQCRKRLKLLFSELPSRSGTVHPLESVDRIHNSRPWPFIMKNSGLRGTYWWTFLGVKNAVALDISRHQESLRQLAYCVEEIGGGYLIQATDGPYDADNPSHGTTLSRINALLRNLVPQDRRVY